MVGRDLTQHPTVYTKESYVPLSLDLLMQLRR